MRVKQYLAKREGQGSNGAREALRWFLRNAPHSDHSEPAGEEATVPDGERKGPEGDDPMPAADHPARKVTRRCGIPPLAVRDQGGADWARDLIATMRARGLRWRTEETYRGWAARFAGSVTSDQ